MLPDCRVLDLTDGGAGLCGQILADLGADVILLEPPDGAPSRALAPFAGDRRDPGSSLRFWSAHRGKRAATLDLEGAEGRERLAEWLRRADVLIESAAPGSARAEWLDATAAANPALVHVSITPFGRSGPKAAWPATDLTVTAASMALAITGDEDRAPLSASVPQAFANAGAEASVGALIALAERARSGLGQHVDVSVQTAMMMTTQSFVLSHLWGDQPLRRCAGGVRLGEFRIRFVYPCRDGFVNFTFLFGDAIGPATARMFRWMCEEGFVDEKTRDKDWVRFALLLATEQEPRSELERVTECIERFCLAHTKQELFAGARERGVLLVPLSDAADLAVSEQLAARDYWTAVAHPELGRSVPYPGPFAKLSASPIRYRRRPPLPGEHADEIETELADAEPRGAPPAVRSDGPPLAGLRVLDFTWVYAGPAITRYLADYGAMVVRVETSQRIEALRSGGPFWQGEIGAERSANYGNVNVGKLGLDLNMATDAGRSVARKLVQWADVVVENYTPKVMRSWGLDWPNVQAMNPRAVMLSSCLCGQTGPQSQLAGYGTMGAALAGFGVLTGWPDRRPAAPFVAYTDYVSPKFATAALLAALAERERSGRGQYIDVAQSEASMQLIAEVLLDQQVNGRVRGARGNAHPDYAPSGVYPVVGEDRWLALAAPDEQSWRSLCALAGRGWQDDPRFARPNERLAERQALDAAIADWTRGWECEALEAALVATGVPAHRAATPEDVASDPQLAARRHFVHVPHTELGPVPFENSRFALSRTPARLERACPMYGEHNQQVLSELLGLSEDEMTELVIAGGLG